MSEIEKTKDATAENPEQLDRTCRERYNRSRKSRHKTNQRRQISRNRFDCRDVFARSRAGARDDFRAVFGAGFLADAFQVAFKISNTLRDLFAEGALSAAFVKVFTDYQVKNSEEEAWRLASLVLNALAVVLCVVIVIGIFLSPYLITLLAKDFSPEKAALATTLTQIMFPFILLVALAAVAMGVLNTKGRFGVPASASTAFNIVSIIFGLGLAYWLSGGQMAGKLEDVNALPPMFAQWAIIGMAIGVLIGGAAQFLIQVPSLFKVGFRFSPILSFTDPGVLQVAKLMAPAIMGASAVQIKVFIDVFLLSGIDGGNSWLPYAFRLMQFPIGVFGVAVGTASIPMLSRLAAENKFGEFRTTLSSSIHLVFLLTLPSACGLVVLSTPIIRLIYERGLFSPTSTDMTAFALIGYSIGLTGYAAIKVLSPSFYALDDAKTPMMVSLTSVVIYPFAGYFLMQFFSQFYVTPETPKGLAHVGLTVATSIDCIDKFFAACVYDAPPHQTPRRQRNSLVIHQDRARFSRDVGGLLFQLLFSARAIRRKKPDRQTDRMFHSDRTRRNRLFSRGETLKNQRNRQNLQRFRAKTCTKIKALLVLE